MNIKSFFFFSLLMLLGLFLASCDKEKTNPLDSSLNQPIMSWVQVSPDTVITDSILVGGVPQPNDLISITLKAHCKITDKEGNTDVKRAKYRIFKQGSSSTLVEGTMQFDSAGTNPSDGYFSVSTSFHIRRVNVGVFSFEAYAEANSGLISNSALHKVTVTRYSPAPIISNLIAPDTITLPPSPYQVLFNMYIAVMDSDGAEDIKEVYFRNLDSPIDTNRHFVLYDDGVQNDFRYDSLANDGLFSCKLQLRWDVPPQTFRFEFAAKDQLGAISNKILHPIVVRQP